jgi:hypothetical protein
MTKRSVSGVVPGVLFGDDSPARPIIETSSLGSNPWEGLKVISIVVSRRRQMPPSQITAGAYEEVNVVHSDVGLAGQ